MNLKTQKDLKKWAALKKPGSTLKSFQEVIFEQQALLAALHNTPQDLRYHPEGDVWTHTCLVCDAAAIIAEREGLDEDDRLLLLVSSLCHDIGKPTTTVIEDERISSHKHAPIGAKICRDFLVPFGLEDKIIEAAAILVAEHLFHVSMTAVSARAAKRFQKRLGSVSFRLLRLLIEADLSGRPPLIYEEPPLLQQMANALNQVANLKQK